MRIIARFKFVKFNSVRLLPRCPAVVTRKTRLRPSALDLSPLSELNMSDTVIADVGSYGKVKGFTTGNVVQFRGLPFASIPTRFRRAVKVNSVPGIFDATKYGPYAPQAPANIDNTVFLFGPYVKNFIEEDSQRSMSEENCLNLNIVSPKDAIGTKKLPVLVWIYGTFFIDTD
jgi:carboxylesterase type B